MGVRDYLIITGPETPTLPSASTPTGSSDYVNKGYADAHYGGSGVNSQGTMSAPISITAAGGITPTASVYDQIMCVQGSGGAVDITANPQIVAGTIAWQKLELIGASDTNTLKLDDGTGLALSGPFIMKKGSVIGLIWDSVNSLWRERFRNEI
jgi:hypothetical protein